MYVCMYILNVCMLDWLRVILCSHVSHTLLHTSDCFFNFSCGCCHFLPHTSHNLTHHILHPSTSHITSYTLPPHTSLTPMDVRYHQGPSRTAIFGSCHGSNTNISNRQIPTIVHWQFWRARNGGVGRWEDKEWRGRKVGGQGMEG